MFGEQEQNGDLRSRVFKLGPGCLKVGMIVVGYVNECNSHGCYIRVANNLSVRGQLNELSDTHLANPQAHFYRNKLVAARIIKIREDGKIDVSLRESVLKFGYSLDVTKLKTGMTLKGIVSEHKKGNAIVQIQNCKYRGTLSQKDFEVPEGKDLHSYFEVMLPVGSEVTCKITKIQKEPSVAITLSTLKKHFAQGIEEEADKQLEQQKTDEDLEHITTLIESIKQISSQNSQQEKLANDIQIESQGKYQQKITEMEQEEDEQDEEEDEENEEQEYEDFNDSEDENDLLIKQAIKDQEKEEEDEEEADSDEILSDQSVVEDMDDEDGENQVNNKKKSSRQKELLKRKKEEEIRKAEQRLLNEDAPPENKDDYERLILKNPNSSFIWIKYMAFAMQNEGIENAREVAERAIKVINFRNETEKLNVWTALMNLEHNFGTEKQLIAIFQRATQLCKPKMVYFRLLDIYRKSEKYDLLVELSKNMLKKFKHSSKVWIQHMKNLSEIKIQLAKEGKSEADSATYDLKEVMKRSLQCLKKQKHIIILSNYARIMYVSGEQETGRTTFDAILSNYPKRTDIWGVFLDMETKYGTVQTCRNLYERCISMSFKPRKMKYFFKRYLQFELQFGSTDKAEIVKQKAQEYVQSVLSKEGGDDEAMDVEGDQQNGNEDDGDAMEEEEESQE